ncbi:MAG: type II CAAX endopeptidase family protein [Acidimicrobiales bacterium]
MIAVLLASLASGIAVTAGAGSDGIAALLMGQLGLWIGFVGAALVAGRFFGFGDIGAGFELGLAAGDVAKSVLIGVAVQLLVVPGIYFPLLAAGVDLDVSGPAVSLFGQVSGPEKAAIALGVVAIAPIAEELLFRGVLLRGLARRLGDGGAVFVSALLFAGTHFQLVQFPGLLAVGLTLAWLARRTGGLASPIWAHIAFNATTVALLW